jgi:penicillin amidase
MPQRGTGAGRRRRLGVLGAVAALLALAAAGLGLLLVLPSRAQLDGTRSVAGLHAAVRIDRDRFGVPTIRGEDRLDVAFGLGFVHAQERFFQMDLLRRSAAGELAALIGRPLLPTDRTMRVHRFRDLARRIVQTLPGRDVADTYARGVNAGLAALGAPPCEYLLLRTRPQPWLAEDVILCVLAMYADLQEIDGELESTCGVLHDLLPPALADFLEPAGTEWDAPLVGEPFAVPPIPGPDVYDLRWESRLGRLPGRVPATASDTALPTLDVERGSNHWAMAGGATADGGALLAGDMHLGLGVPNIWYRATLDYPGANGERRRVTGVTLPGTPAVVAGSNGDVAWAFTNSEVDTSDLVILETDTAERTYRVPAAADSAARREFERHLEIIAVKGAPDDTLEVRWTIWGPVIDRDHAGRLRAYRWVAHDVEAADLGLLDLEKCTTLDAAIAAAQRTRIPTQNCLIADRAGRIGWTLMGPVPRRFGGVGSVPQSWADGKRGWDPARPYLAPEEVPRLLDPPGARLWSANNRLVDGAMLELLGSGHYALGARARQIRDALQQLDHATPLDMLHLQLDDRALLLERWQRLLLEVLAADSAAAPRWELRPYVERWGGHAAIGSVGYRAVREFRSAVIHAVLEPLLAGCRAADARVRETQLLQREGPVWRIVEERPRHLLDPRYASWDALLAAAADTTLARLRARGPDLAARTWGEYNTTRIRHPLSRALPMLRRWLDMPPHPLPGDRDMPRVQSPTAGASQRMVVSPGREEHGFFHMPGGQSGHPLSPYYRNSHPYWERGDPTPFLPGPAQHTLTLVPREGGKSR